MAALERSTKELMAASMKRLGISTDSGPSVLAAAGKDVTDFETTLRATAVGAAQFLDYYTRLRQLVAKGDRLTIDALIAHELAVEVFARRELTGERTNSLQPIRALWHVRFR